jgi:hypothetical protein
MIDILRPPPVANSIRAKKWVVRDKSTLSTTLQKSAYPSSVACRCFIYIPNEIFMTEDTTMAIWDEAKQQWTEEGITDFQYVESTRQVQFYTTAVGLYGLIRSRTSDMPYKSWKLHPVRYIEKITDVSSSGNRNTNFERHVRLTVETQRFEIVIDIIGTVCKLVKPNVDQLKDIIGIEHTPGALFHKLQRRGINLFPTPYDCSNCDGIKKPNKVSILYST